MTVTRSTQTDTATGCHGVIDPADRARTLADVGLGGRIGDPWLAIPDPPGSREAAARAEARRTERRP